MVIALTWTSKSGIRMIHFLKAMIEIWVTLWSFIIKFQLAYFKVDVFFMR